MGYLEPLLPEQDCRNTGQGLPTAQCPKSLGGWPRVHGKGPYTRLEGTKLP